MFSIKIKWVNAFDLKEIKYGSKFLGGKLLNIIVT